MTDHHDHLPSPAEPTAAADDPSASPPIEVADGKDRQLDPKVISAWRIGAAIGAAVLSAGLLIVAMTLVISDVVLGSLNLLPPLVWLLLVALLALRAYFWPVLRYRHTFYRVDGSRIDLDSCCAPIVSPAFTRVAQRSTSFCSSRTFPGQP